MKTPKFQICLRIILTFSFLSNTIAGLSQATNVQDSLELVKFYNQTGGPSWTRKNNWLNTAVPLWEGIKMTSSYINDSTFEFRVYEINLSNNNLKGTLPNITLPFLGSLILENNSITGNIPPLSLPNLTVLAVRNNELFGPVPQLNIPSLNVFDVTGNKLSGTIDFITTLNKATSIYLTSNQFTGQIPLLSSPFLKNLAIDENNFNSLIPPITLPALESLTAISCNLSGNFPALSCPKLRYLNFSNNNLTGGIPNIIFSNLSSFILSNNKFSGSVPQFSCPQLEFLYLDKNELSGDLNSFASSIIPNIKYLTLSVSFPQLVTFKTKDFQSYCRF
jgi:hypothetical protein